MNQVKKWLAIVLTVCLVGITSVFQLNTSMNANELDSEQDGAAQIEEQVKEEPVSDADKSDNVVEIVEDEEPAAPTDDSEDSLEESEAQPNIDTDSTASVKDITVTAKDMVKYYGTRDPEFTAVLTGGDEASVKYSVSRVEGDDEAVGTHIINVYGGANQNGCNVHYVDGTLTILPQSINPRDKGYVGVVVDKPADVTCDGEEHRWAPVVIGAIPLNLGTANAHHSVLAEGVDYVLEYSTDDFINPCEEIAVKITGIGNYTGTVTRKYSILKSELPMFNANTSEEEELVADATDSTAETVAQDGASEQNHAGKADGSASQNAAREHKGGFFQTLAEKLQIIHVDDEEVALSNTELEPVDGKSGIPVTIPLAAVVLIAAAVAGGMRRKHR